MNDADVKKLIQEYSKNYCLFLEAAYGSSMMSEGGEKAIDRMLHKETLHNKTLLDIGFGLGGVAFYLADKHHAHVHGVEINPWMVNEASRRTPTHLQNKVCFHEHHPDSKLPFPDEHFDVVFSKGVLTHLKDKNNLFNEINRVLKLSGSFVIDDWLSPQVGQWGERLKKMCEVEGLTLYAETVENYIKTLKNTHFTNIEIRDENHNYYQYNLTIVERLIQQKERESGNPIFKEVSLDEAIESYRLIADSIKDNELLIRWFRARKIKNMPLI